MYDKERKDQVGEVVYIDVIEDCDGYDEFGSIMWNVFFCDVKFSDGVVKCYRDCRLKKVKWLVCGQFRSKAIRDVK